MSQHIPPKMRDRIETFIREGKNYEAQQLYLMQAKRALMRSNYEDSASIAEAGALRLLSLGETRAGGELAQLYLEAMKGSEGVWDDSTEARTLRVYNAFPAVKQRRHSKVEVDTKSNTDDIPPQSERSVANALSHSPPSLSPSPSLSSSSPSSSAISSSSSPSSSSSTSVPSSDIVTTSTNSAFKPGLAKTLPEIIFMEAATEWSIHSSQGRYPYGSPALSHELALAYANAGAGWEASKAYAKCPDHVAEHAQLAVDRTKGVEKAQREAFMCSIVLLYLAHSSLKAANRFFHMYSTNYPSDFHDIINYTAFSQHTSGTRHSLPPLTCIPPSPSSLIEFIGYLLPTCERDAVPLFDELATRYAKAISSDPASEAKIPDLLRHVGITLFGKPKPTSFIDMFMS